MNDYKSNPDYISWKNKLRREPEIAGWFVDAIQNSPKHTDKYHWVYVVIAESLGQSIETINFQLLDAREAVQAVMSERTKENYNWEKFERPRQNSEQYLFEP